MMDELLESADWLRSKGMDAPEVGIILGTGLHGLAKQIAVEKEFNYSVIPHFPIATVEYHFGKLLYGNLAGKKVIACQGRFHYYEGYSMHQVVMPVRVMKLLGVKSILLSNASGSLNPDFKKGSLMLIDDHINMQPENPLRGLNMEELGVRFPDMSQPYDAHLNQSLKAIAQELEIPLHEGVYASVPGPNLETRAEYRFLRMAGADAVGMSTVPEVIACNHMRLPCCCISVLTDECNPETLKPVEFNEILATAQQAEGKLTQLYMELIQRI
jgi:purine-nucleoside phosphorylase